MSEHYFKLRPTCPACRSTCNQELYSANFTEPPLSTYLAAFYSAQGGVEVEYLTNEHYILDECKECGLIYQRSIPDDFLMTRLYEHWIDPQKAFSLHVKGHEIGYYAALAREVELTIRHFGIQPSKLVYLDVGMGWGEWCFLAKAYGCTIYGTELSPSRSNYVKASGVPIIKWEELPKHQFDFINTEQVFEHLADPLETLQCLSKSLKPHGVIKISVPNGWDIKRRLAIMDWTAPKGTKNSLNLVAPLEHINCFTRDVLVKMGEDVGLLPIQLRAQIRLDRTLLDCSLRHMLKPSYDWLSKRVSGQARGTTGLFFERESA